MTGDRVSETIPLSTVRVWFVHSRNERVVDDDEDDETRCRIREVSDTTKTRADGFVNGTAKRQSVIEENFTKRVLRVFQLHSHQESRQIAGLKMVINLNNAFGGSIFPTGGATLQHAFTFVSINQIFDPVHFQLVVVKLTARRTTLAHRCVKREIQFRVSETATSSESQKHHKRKDFSPKRV